MTAYEMRISDLSSDGCSSDLMMAAVRKTIRVLRCLLAASAAPLAIALFAVAAAQEAQGAPVDIRISSGSLSSALMALGREAKVQIVFTPDSVEGRKSKGVRGRMTVDAEIGRESCR